MQVQLNERLAVVETDVKHLIDLLEKHVSDPCGNCKLTDDVAVGKNDILWLKRVGYVVGGTTFTAMVGLVLDRLKLI